MEDRASPTPLSLYKLNMRTGSLNGRLSFDIKVDRLQVVDISLYDIHGRLVQKIFRGIQPQSQNKDIGLTSLPF